ncbi:MAG: L-2-amino-thiazoline-4-carboxylic acid hydrolase [Clostridia bacterium]|nr:L-2-amino-thiazoline-4-carboxylic acid hydrolase [Clostridia bacterium]
MAVYIPMPKESYNDLRERLKTKASTDEYEEKWQEIENIYRQFIDDIPDIGGKKNMMWKSLYGAIACFAWYEAFDPHPDNAEMKEVLRGNTVRGDGTGGFSKIDFNRPFVQKIIYGIIRPVAKKFNKKKANGTWGNTWGLDVNPLNRTEGISIHLVGCPIADFAKSHGYMELMPIFCQSDYEAMRSNMGKELYREHTVAEGFDDCDYWMKNK